jgi:hypothetical protein
MEGDPKNPNAWWAVRIRLPRMFPEHLTWGQKRRMLWLVPLMVTIFLVELFYMIKLMAAH